MKKSFIVKYVWEEDVYFQIICTDGVSKSGGVHGDFQLEEWNQVIASFEGVFGYQVVPQADIR